MLACLVTGWVTGAGTSSVPVEAATSEGEVSVTLERPRTRSDTVVLRGTAPARARVRIVRRVEDGWVRVTVDRANRRGRYRVIVPWSADARWVVRAASRGTRSETRTVGADQLPAVVDPPVDEPPVEPPPVDACGEQPLKADGTRWECSFVDDFSGTELDGSRWLAHETSFSGITNGPEGCFRKEPWTVAVENGTLLLSAQRTEEPFTCHSPLGSFTTHRASAAISTKGRFNQAFGRFAFRAKLPTVRVPGSHSTLWLFPDKRTYGPWPLSGEIDVAEWYSALPGQVFPSLHYADGNRDVNSGLDGLIADVSEYHTYVLEWTPTKMQFFYDERLVHEHQWTPLAPLLGSQPFDKPFNVVLNQVWGQLWNAPGAETPDRATMTVDWVRVWK